MSGLLGWSMRLNRTAAYRDAGAAMDAARGAFARGDLARPNDSARRCSPPRRKDARAWTLLTETALQRERLDAALLPSDSIAHILRAKCLVLSGELGHALRAAETASEMIGTATEALDALGAIFGMLGQHRRGAELFRRAVAARPEADTHCRLAIAQNPDYALAHYIPSDLRIQSADRNQIAEMESLVERGGVDWRSMLHYALGKECEDVEAHDRAFAHVAAGARLLR
jgi:tetratricopeptide (TPR) repeat protein